MSLAARAFRPAGPQDYGAFVTPEGTAEFMVSLLALERGHRVLDPCAGEGAFVDALVRAGVPQERISAWDLDERACAILRRRYPNVRVERRDALLAAPGDARFDRVIANPPYLNKASAYVRAHRAELRRRFGRDVGSGETFAMFLSVALGLLAEAGRLAFIVSDTFRTLGTHERLRRRILGEHRLEVLASAPRGLFPDTSVRAVILGIGRGAPGGEVRVLAQAGSEEDYLRGIWTRIPAEVFLTIDGAPFALEAPPTIVRLFRQPLRLSDWASGHIGMHTRDNRRYLAALEGSALARRFERRRREPGEHPVISATEARTRRWQAYLKEGGEKDFFHPVVEYLDWRPAARAAYVIPKGSCFGRPGIAVSGVSRRLSARLMPAGCYWDTNKVMGFVPHREADTALLLGLFNSDLFSFIAKRLLNESSSIQIRDLWKLPVPRPPSPAASRIALAASECVRRKRRDPAADIASPRRALNEAVYRALRISPAERGVIDRFLGRTGHSW